MEAQRLGYFDLLNQPCGLHLVDNLQNGKNVNYAQEELPQKANFLLALGLLDQVCICSSARNELLNVGNFILLLLVCLHLVYFVFGLGSDVGGIVTGVVHHLEEECDRLESATFKAEDEGIVRTFFLGVKSIMFVHTLSMKS